MSLIDKLNNIINCKDAIRAAINNKGGVLTESSKLRDYATAIDNLTGGGGSSSSSVDLVKPIYAEQKNPAPNTGHLEKIFFNTKLTTDQVDALIANANLTFTPGSTSVYPMLMTDTGKIITISDFSSQVGGVGVSAWLIADMNSQIIYYASPAVAAAFSVQAGWTESSFTSFDTGEIAITGELVQEIQGVTVGSQNNLLTDLVYLYSKVDTGEVEIVKTLSGQYKLIDTNVNIDTGIDTKYTYDFINNINDDTKEISIIKDIVINTKEDAIINRTVSTYTNNRVNAIRDYAFYGCDILKEVSFPKATIIGPYAFAYDSMLTNIEIPLVTSIGEYAFYFCSELVNINNMLSITEINEHAFDYCELLKSINGPLVETIVGPSFTGSGLESVVLPKLTIVLQETFAHTYHLKEADLSNIRAIHAGAFYCCYELVKLFIAQTDKVCTLENTNAFEECYHILGTVNSTDNPNGLKDGYIYVPASLLSQYKVATNWSTYASQIIGHENLEAGATLPSYTTSNFTKQTWYSDEKLTNVVTYVATSGTYYCKLSA